jgi:gentisate 1,2-dioxygenase
MNNLRMGFAPAGASFVDRSGLASPDNEPWPPVILRKEEIDAEIERLASLPKPADGRRTSLVTHSRALASAPGLAPGIEVGLSVLRPGESTESFRHNATDVSFCIRGRGHAGVADRRIEFQQYDVWNTPSFVPHWRVNDSDELQACLVYSNAPLLKYMQVYVAESNPPPTDLAEGEAGESVVDPRKASPYGEFVIGDDGAMLMPYERLIDPPLVTSAPLFWPWERVHAELRKLQDLGQEYIGRRLYLLYNPATGRTNGTTPNFFATITIRPPGIVDRPHRHVSAAINYYFHGSGRSSVGGSVYEWKAGDLMLSAPGWTVHNHASYDDYVYELTIQDQPLNIAMESLLWQENMKRPPALLGSQGGFQTNRRLVTR